MHVGLATPALNDGDAVGNDLLGMARVLRGRGHRVELFAELARLGEDVRPLSEVRSANPDVFIYHHSIRCDVGVRAVEELPGKVAVKYHNITPPRFFAGVNDDATAGAEAGLKQAARLAKSRAAIWVDSAFNGRELAALVPGRATTELPPFHQAEKLSATTPDARATAGLDGWGTTFLCVGRVAPNKNLTLAVEAFAAYRRRFDRHARLILAGEHVFPTYTNRVADRIADLGLTDAVTVAGRVTITQLKALYLTADAVLVTSEHEGFCVPLVEAMALGTPVVAVPAAAVPDTAGDAATFADADPEALADAMNAVVSDSTERERQLVAGRARFAERFSTSAIERRFLELFDAL